MLQVENSNIASRRKTHLNHPFAKLYAHSFIVAYRAVGVKLSIEIFDDGIIIRFETMEDLFKYSQLRIKLLSQTLDLILNCSQREKQVTHSVNKIKFPLKISTEEAFFNSARQ